MPTGPRVDAMASDSGWLTADWPAPPGVRAITTLRGGGSSGPPYDSFNLADHVGDRPQAVAQNRAYLGAALGLPAQPVWLRQVHGTRVVHAAAAAAGSTADGSYADAAGLVCAVLTADCLPVLLCDSAGKRVAALHAGWRGLAAGILESGIEAMGLAPETLMAWLGPAIGPSAFEVGPEVREALAGDDPVARTLFSAGRDDRFFADLCGLARLRLQRAGVSRVYGGGLCTASDPARFYSYRRDGECGRMASLIWLER